MKKRLFLGAALACAGVFALASCGEDADYTVGILQYVTHDALGAATKGFKEELEAKVKEAGKTVKFIEKNPEADDTQMKTMATSLVRDCDLVMGNATPAATALKTAAATEGKKNLPILFTSVTDPHSAELVSSYNNPEGQITGTSDLNPISIQMDLVFDFNPSAKKIGFLYTQSETNSKSQCDEAEKYLKELKKDTATKTITDASGITAAVTYLIDNDNCDVIYVPTDNLVAANMSTVANVTNPKKIPVICGEGNMVKNGGTFSIGISYTELGKTTGDQAAEILINGKAIKDVPVVDQLGEPDKFEFEMNQAALTTMGFTLSQEFKTKYGVN